MVSPSLLDSIKREEGFVGTVYQDHLGKDTIGYGFLVRDLWMEEDIASLLLQRYLEKLALKVNRRHPWVVEAPAVLRDVVYEMCYQLGVDGFSRFKKTVKLMIDGQYEDASVEMLDSLWGKKQTPERAKRLSDRVRSLA
jgi:lysozyme